MSNAKPPDLQIEPKPPGVLFLSRWVWICGLALFLGAAAAGTLALFARIFVLAEIATHFRVFYALSAFGACLCFSAGRRWRWTLASVAILVWQAWAIVPWYFPPSGTAATPGQTLKLLSSNVDADTSNYDALIALVRREHPDLVFIQELSPEWAEALRAIEDAYPHRIVSARRDYFGLGLYSRYPLENVDTGDPVTSDVPLMRAELVVGGRRVQLVNVHLAPPESGRLTKLRYKQYHWLTEFAEVHSGPIVVAGDFNCTMWSPLYNDLVRRGRLLSARRGRGIMPSWFPIAGSPVLLIPIDQILAGGGAHFRDLHLGSRIGSDHCPLIAELHLPN